MPIVIHGRNILGREKVVLAREISLTKKEKHFQHLREPLLCIPCLKESLKRKQSESRTAYISRLGLHEHLNSGYSPDIKKKRTREFTKEQKYNNSFDIDKAVWTIIDIEYKNNIAKKLPQDENNDILTFPAYQELLCDLQSLDYKKILKPWILYAYEPGDTDLFDPIVHIAQAKQAAVQFLHRQLFTPDSWVHSSDSDSDDASIATTYIEDND